MTQKVRKGEWRLERLKTLKNSKLLNPADFKAISNLAKPVFRLTEKIKLGQAAFLRKIKSVVREGRDIDTFKKIIDSFEHWPLEISPSIWPGDPSRVALIGRGMDDAQGVRGAREFLEKNGVKVEIFQHSDAAENQLRRMVEARGRPLTYDEMKTTRSYAENKEWVEKLKHENYTIVDSGTPKSYSPLYNKNLKAGRPSANYDMEKGVLYYER